MTSQRLEDEPRGGPATAHETIAARAAEAPDAVAVEQDDAAITYGELCRRIRRLSRALLGLGVGPEALVGVCAERSIAWIVGAIAILEAGGAYLPLDPGYPRERLAGMIADARVRLVLADEGPARDLPQGAARVVPLDAAWGGSAVDAPIEAPGPPRAGPRSLAYVVYTSGSTGEPKGCLVEHRGLVNQIHAERRATGVGRGDRILQLCAAGFDASICEIFAALGNGATLRVAPRDARVPGPRLVKLLRDAAVTMIFVPAAVLSALPRGELPALRAIVVGGETCPLEVASHWARGRRLYNAYGPTEATICATIAACGEGAWPPVVGRPIANLRAYVLDPRGEPVPDGVPGELYLGGAGVGRGYLGRPALTAAAFVPDPFGPEPGARLYRTGDLARRRASGDLELLGRVDRQVKIRGVRVEPGEIEAALRRHAAVAEAVVVERRGTEGDRLLAAYVVLREGREASGQALRASLRERLPDAMVPAHVVIVPAIPLSPNGKIDRAALPAPGSCPFRYRPCRAQGAPPWRERGVYLIAGGLGTIGFAIAEHLAASARARLVLLDRAGLPRPDQWARWIALHPPDDWTSRWIRKVRALEARGAEVLVAGVEVADEEGVRRVVARAEERFGAVDGVFVTAQAGGEAPSPDAALAGDERDALHRALASGTGACFLARPAVLCAILDEERRAAAARQAPDEVVGTEFPRGPAARPYVAPRTELERVITAFLEARLEVERVSIHDDFFEVGGHSLLAASLFAVLEEQTGVALPLSTLLEAPTAASLAPRFAGRTARAPPAAEGPWRCLVPIQVGGARAPLFCVHAKGGNALAFRAFAATLGPDRPLFAFQSLGLDGVAAPLRDVRAMAARYVDELRAVRPAGPYHLAGASMGGMVAFEMAVELRARGEEVGLVALFDTYGPYHFDFRRSDGSLRHHGGRIGQLEGPLRALGKRVERATRRSRVEDVWKASVCRARHAIGRRLSGDLSAWYVAWTNEEAATRYVPTPYPGKITLFRAKEQHAYLYADPTLGWSAWARGGVFVVDVPGTHDDNVEQPRLHARLRALLDALA